MESSCDIDLVDFTESIGAELTTELVALCRFAIEQETGRCDWAVSIVLTNDEHLTRLHDEFMGIPQPTDIMTFPDDDQPGGDIVISVEQAERQRHDDGWPLSRELAFLVLHGVLHLAGWDDSTEELRAAMLTRQRALLDAFQRDSLSSR